MLPRCGESVANEALKRDGLDATIRLKDNPGVNLTHEERDAAVFAVLRLDPLGHRERADGLTVRDLAKYWTVLHKSAERVPELTFENLFPLTASAKELEKAPETDEFGFDDGFTFFDTPGSIYRPTFVSHATLQAITSMMDEAGQ